MSFVCFALQRYNILGKWANDVPFFSYAGLLSQDAGAIQV